MCRKLRCCAQPRREGRDAGPKDGIAMPSVALVRFAGGGLIGRGVVRRVLFRRLIGPALRILIGRDDDEITRAPLKAAGAVFFLVVCHAFPLSA